METGSRDGLGDMQGSSRERSLETLMEGRHPEPEPEEEEERGSSPLFLPASSSAPVLPPLDFYIQEEDRRELKEQEQDGMAAVLQMSSSAHSMLFPSRYSASCSLGGGSPTTPTGLRYVHSPAPSSATSVHSDGIATPTPSTSMPLPAPSRAPLPLSLSMRLDQEEQVQDKVDGQANVAHPNSNKPRNVIPHSVDCDCRNGRSGVSALDLALNGAIGSGIGRDGQLEGAIIQDGVGLLLGETDDKDGQSEHPAVRGATSVEQQDTRRQHTQTAGIAQILAASVSQSSHQQQPQPVRPPPVPVRSPRRPSASSTTSTGTTTTPAALDQHTHTHTHTRHRSASTSSTLSSSARPLGLVSYTRESPLQSSTEASTTGHRRARSDSVHAYSHADSDADRTHSHSHSHSLLAAAPPAGAAQIAHPPQGGYPTQTPSLHGLAASPCITSSPRSQLHPTLARLAVDDETLAGVHEDIDIHDIQDIQDLSPGSTASVQSSSSDSSSDNSSDGTQRIPGNLSVSLPSSPSRAATSSSLHLDLGHPQDRIFSLRSRIEQSRRLPLTPLEEVNSPSMKLDSPADLAADPTNPFETRAFADAVRHLKVQQDEQQLALAAKASDASQTFYHALLELVNTESAYLADLTDLVEVHFSLLSFASFITQEQRGIIVRDAVALLEVHRRLDTRLRRVDEDLGWVRESDEQVGLPISPFGNTEAAASHLPELSRVSSDQTNSGSGAVEGGLLRSPVRRARRHSILRRSSDERYPSPSSAVLASPTSPARRLSYNDYTSALPTPTGPVSRTLSPGRRFKSSDATVLDAARRISAIFTHEASALSAAYRPFCSGHMEAMDVLKQLAGSTNGNKLDMDAFEAQCSAHLAARRRGSSNAAASQGPGSTRLHFADFLIKPVQRICQYPLLFRNMLKNANKIVVHSPSTATSSLSSPLLPAISLLGLSDGPTTSIPLSFIPPSASQADLPGCVEKMQAAHDTLKEVAAEVDTAQKMRILEIASIKLALRIEIHTAEHAALLNGISQVMLIGSAHVIYTHASTQALQGPTPVVKAGFYGLVLYASHLVFFKVKKTNVYEPRHWLPLRLFDLQKVADGEGLLPYAFRMSYHEHSFEVGSLCHAEQNIWMNAIDTAAVASRKAWIEAISENPIAIDETVICSVPLDPVAAAFDTVSPGLGNSECAVFPTSPEASLPPTRAPSITSAGEAENVYATVRPRLSLKPPAQRVAVDLRMADLLSEAILSARAQSKRSHAMPLHGPPPRSATLPSPFNSNLNRRPHSFHPGAFSYRNMIESSSRRTSLAESERSASSAGGMRQLFSSSTSSANIAGMQGSSAHLSSSGTDDAGLLRKPTKLRRSKTSGQVSLSPDSESSDRTTKPTRRASTLGKIRRRATSLVPDSASMKILADLRAQHQQQAIAAPMARAPSADKVQLQVVTTAAAAPAEPAIVDPNTQATVERNSSTSSSSSYASNSTNPSLQYGPPSVETPQSSLPASPLLTPVDLETQSRWTKIGDALTHTLTRKRSFASSRPILAVPPEALLEGIQLEQAQNAAEYIYTGRGNGGSSASSLYSHGASGTGSAVTSAHSLEKRYSWDRLARVASSNGKAGPSGSQSHYRTNSGLSAPASILGGARSASGGSTNSGRGDYHNMYAGRSAPNLPSLADKRQNSTGSLWSVFGRNTDPYGHSHHSSPAHSIYEDAAEEDDSSAYPSPVSRAQPLPDVSEFGVSISQQLAAAHAAKVAAASVASSSTASTPTITVDTQAAASAGKALPVTRVNPLSGSGPTQEVVSPQSVASSSSSTLTSPSLSPSSSTAGSPQQAASGSQLTRSGSLVKRRNSLSARLRAFRTLGSGMTPVRQQQPSRSHASRS